MKILIVILLWIKVAFFFEVDFNNHSSKGLVFNGTRYDAKKYPYVVSLTITNTTNYEQKVCTATMVKKLYAMTAAHCVVGYKAKEVRVYLGTELNNIYQDAVQLYIPEAYIANKNELLIYSDLAVIKLEKPFSTLKKYLRIGGSPKDFKHNKAIKCTLIGFGRITNNTGKLGTKGFMMTTTVTHGRRACQLSDSPLVRDNWKEYLCSKAGRITMTCKGDSGGPMICKNKLYGVCSFNFNYKIEQEFCGGPDIQSVHTFLSAHSKWINNIIEPKKKSSGNSLKPHLTLHTSLAILLCVDYYFKIIKCINKI